MTAAETCAKVIARLFNHNERFLKKLQFFTDGFLFGWFFFFLFYSLTSVSTVLIQTPSAWASWVRWGRERAQPSGLWASFRALSVVPEAQPATALTCGAVSSVHVSDGFLPHWNLERAARWWACHTRCRWDSNGSAVAWLQFRSSAFTSDFFLLPCWYEKKAILVLHLGFRHQPKRSLCTRACPTPF